MGPTGASDAVLWTRSLAGDEYAFGDLFDRHRDRVFRHARRLVDSTQDAEDVTAAAFLELWRRRDDVRLVDDSVVAWLLVTANYTALNLRRATRRYRKLLARLPREESTPDGTAQAMSAHALSERGELGAALRRLRLSDLEIITLVVFEDIPVSDAASHLGISTEAAKSRLHRARRRLRAYLQQAAPARVGTAEIGGGK